MKTFNGLKKNKGFVILYAILLTSMLVSITLGVANTSLKEIKFSTSGKHTNEAFFASDTGTECALFNDKSTSNSFVETGGSGTVNCLGSNVPLVGVYPIWSFTLPLLGSGGQGCAKVIVDKSVSPATTIVSKGYDVGDPACNSTNPNRVERELRVVYNAGAIVPPPTGIDLVPEDLYWVPDPVSSGGSATVGFRIRNAGDVSAGTFALKITKNGTTFCTWTVFGLAPGATFERGPGNPEGDCSGSFGITNAQNGDVIALTVDYLNESTESNEANNIMTRTISTSSASYRYVRWLITKRKGSATNSIQVAEFVLLQNGSPVAWPASSTATNPAGSNPVNETPAKVIDGSSATKWLDFNFAPIGQFTGSSELDVDTGFGNSMVFNGYKWMTANDASERDPISWSLYGSTDGFSYVLLDSRLDQSITETRQVYTVDYSF